ncbi:MAG: gamma-glutamylcyclotransferase [Thermoplasmatota archaeon]|nr:gamma-glutamylcyclotransferase [Halobacteriales archaeon]
MSALLFVYGTLRTATGHRMARLLQGQARRIGRATAAGRLFDLGDYPGMAPARISGDRVRGEVFELHDAGTLAALDEYEGTEDPEPEFIRRQVFVTFTDGTRRRAWAYQWTGATKAAARPIASGDYLKRRHRPKAA